jgi:diguanylate cyclase (GGDEF)-like protein
LSNLKALQSNLRHLTWQAKKIAEGDFSQKADFSGDFSDAFNKMTDRLRENSLHLTDLANLDTLTKIPNRRSLRNFLKNAFINCRELCVLMIDIDLFKKVNDAYGHGAGDDALVHVVGLIVRQVRNTDLVARYGGEEFVAVLPDAGLEIAGLIAGRILKTVENTPLRVAGADKAINLTLSIGVSCKMPGDSSEQEIITRSDVALYEAKHNGRNQIRVG